MEVNIFASKGSLWAVASKEELNGEKMQALAVEHMTPV